MKKQIYIVEIDMPDGDLVSSGWLQDLIQQDLDSEEDKNRQVVFVREISLPSDLDEAAKQFQGRWDNDQSPEASFKAGAQWRDAQIPKLPDSIDEAAEEWCKTNHKGIALSADKKSHYLAEGKDAFKAGAEWMAGKWETIDGEITTTSDNGWEIIRIPNKLYPLGTKVTVQIRKK